MTDRENENTGIVFKPGQVFNQYGIRHLPGQQIPTPKEPGIYEVNLDEETGEYSIMKVAEIVVPPKKRKGVAFLVGEVLGATICVTVILGALAVGVRYLILWLWGI